MPTGTKSDTRRTRLFLLYSEVFWYSKSLHASYDILLFSPDSGLTG